MKLSLMSPVAAIVGAAILLPATASAADNGPCHYCEMEPIVVKGDRKKDVAVKGMSKMKARTSRQKPQGKRR